MFPDAGPTARALLALELLQSRPGITAAQLGERLGVSERAARRSLATLRDVGVPVESVRGPHGGYRLGRGLRLPPLVFTATEALGLVMAVLDGNHVAADPDQPVGAALGKLVAALPENVGRAAALMRDHAAAAPDPQAAHPDPIVAAALVAAVAEQERVRLDYRTDDRAWQEQVDPWGVVVRRGRWYLLCHSLRVDDTRTYRVDRVTSVAGTGQHFCLPPGLDPVLTLEHHLAVGWQHPVRVVFHAPAHQVQPWLGPSLGHLSPDPDHPDRSVLVGSTNNLDAYAAEYLAPLPFEFDVSGCPPLQQAVRRVVQRLTRAAGGPPARP